MLESGILQLAILLSIATILGIVLRYFKQPVLLAYLATGAVLGYYNVFHIVGNETYTIFSELGIMFLLFLVGLEINYSSLKQVGKTSFIVGLSQIIFTCSIGFAIAQVFGFSMLTSAYIAAALTFSSTIIIVKLLSEKRQLQSLYGKISIGFMLVQDFVAILLLVFLAGIQSSGTVEYTALAITIAKAIGLLFAMLLLGRYILPHVFDRVARSQELLFLTSTAWVIAVGASSAQLGLSIEIGGFLAGIALANSAENFQIGAQIRSLRDFFILIFFVILGSSLVLFDFSGLIVPIIIFSLFVLIGNPLIVLLIMSIMGYRHRTSFLAGVTVAQISEFSLILAALGLKLGHIDESVVALITAVGVITITLSTYMIVFGDALARKFEKILMLFERRVVAEELLPDDAYDKPVVLIGANRTGESIAHHVPKDQLLIVDFDPDVAKRMSNQGYTVLMGDVSDDDVFEKANIDKADIIISTSEDFNDNRGLLLRLKNLKGKRKVIVRAETSVDAKALYKEGAHYVIFPHLTAGHYLGKNISEDLNVRFLSDLKKRDLAVIRRRIA